MKRLWPLIVLAVLISIGWTVSSQALELVPVTSFDTTWQTKTYGDGGPVSVITNGGTVNLSAQGVAGTQWTEIDFYKTGTTGIVGMWATLRVDQATNTNGSTNIDIIGIKQFIGKIGNEEIRLLISLKQYSNNKSIWYQIRAMDTNTYAMRTITQGTFGDTSGGWKLGESLTVAFVRVNPGFTTCGYMYQANHLIC
jgi:hypothetical protein